MHDEILRNKQVILKALKLNWTENSSKTEISIKWQAINNQQDEQTRKAKRSRIEGHLKKVISNIRPEWVPLIWYDCHGENSKESLVSLFLSNEC